MFAGAARDDDKDQLEVLAARQHVDLARSAFLQARRADADARSALTLAVEQLESSIAAAQAALDARAAARQARNGVLRAQTIVLDTGPVLALGKGQIDLRDEAIAIQLRGKPKEPRLIRVIAPIRIDGRLVDPGVGVELDAAAGQGSIAAVAAFFAPFAAILPFVSLDLAKDADCGAVIKQARGA